MMKTEIIKIRDYESLPSFVPQKSVVAGGGIVAFPTETVYGIAVAYDSDQAIESIFRLKERERGKPLTLHISNASRVDAFVDWTRLSDEEIRIYRSLIAKFWPGPLTVILPKKNTVSDVLTGGLSTVAFRFPSHPVSIAFIEACGGAVAATSANLSGGFSCTTGAAVEQELGGKIACILDADSGILGIESTVISIQGGVKILRQGAIGIRMIERVLRGSVQRSESGKGV
ncbi:MAG: L-threonylcarbamoyladenylate synthase, partial [Bacillota bacterium]|nr:L-threonylcarbamoyladenylate synthase [Bacillota bacterium]